jgi:hypothetical protein
MSKRSLERGEVRHLSSNYCHNTTTTTVTITVDNTFKFSNEIQLKHKRILLEKNIIVNIIYNIYITNTMHFNVCYILFTKIHHNHLSALCWLFIYYGSNVRKIELTKILNIMLSFPHLISYIYSSIQILAKRMNKTLG